MKDIISRLLLILILIALGVMAYTTSELTDVVTVLHQKNSRLEEQNNVLFDQVDGLQESLRALEIQNDSINSYIGR